MLFGLTCVTLMKYKVHIILLLDKQNKCIIYICLCIYIYILCVCYQGQPICLYICFFKHWKNNVLATICLFAIFYGDIYICDNSVIY